MDARRSPEPRKALVRAAVDAPVALAVVVPDVAPVDGLAAADAPVALAVVAPVDPKDAVNMASKNQVDARRSPEPRKALVRAAADAPVALAVVVPDVAPVDGLVAADAPVALAVVVPDVAPVDPRAVASTV